MFTFFFYIFTRSNKNAFTLAEVLITLSIIGIVAAVSMPTLITDINERRNSERHANIAQKVTHAIEHMRATGVLVPYSSTEEFVNELQKHLKISKICYKDNLTDCWPTATVTDSEGNEYNVANAKTGADLGRNTTTNNVGLILADGATIILNYDNKDPGLDVGDKVTASSKPLPVGKNKIKTFPYTTSSTSSIDFVMDVNGKSKPNRETDKNKRYFDIRSFDKAKFSSTVAWEDGRAGKILFLGQPTISIDCRSSNYNDPDYGYCAPVSNYLNDYWAGAHKACFEATKGKGTLPTISKLNNIRLYKSDYNSLTGVNTYFWSSEEDYRHSLSEARILDLGDGDVGSDYRTANFVVLCVPN